MFIKLKSNIFVVRNSIVYIMMNKTKSKWYLTFILTAVLFSCQNQKNVSETDMNNPFFKEWNTPYSVPPFDEIKEMHYLPAIKQGITEHESEIKAIVENTEEPTFENTILAYDKAGALLTKVNGVFSPLNSANTNEEMQAIAREISPLMTKHRDNLSMNPELFARI